MKKIINIVTFLTVITVSLSANEIKEIKLQGKEAIMKMGKTLKMNMKKHMKKGGAVGAAKFCSTLAVEIQSEVNKTYKSGISVKRVTLKPRNPKNIASADEAKVLKNLEKLKSENKELPKLIVKKIADNEYKVYKPIVMGKVCLKCHAGINNIDKKVYSVIKEYYDADKATGYKLGDIRGAFIANIITK